MKSSLIAVSLAMLVAFLLVLPAAAAKPGAVDPIAVDISHRLKNEPALAQSSEDEKAAVLASSETTTSQCFGDDSSLTITISSFDPANPGDQDVVFFKETAATSTGKATLWVAWDFRTTDYGREDIITCDQLEYLQGQMDSIVDTDVYYFGDYVQRPAGNENIDVMIYNIVDETYFDEDFPFYIAGFFWGAINETFDRNMIFVDTYNWEDRLGPDAENPFLYEGTVAHELEHLIHHDHDVNEDSWIDEGMADLAEYLNGFGHPTSHVVYYMAFHRTSLTNWGGGLEDYGASYLFQLYLLENFGTMNGGWWDNTWTRTLIDEQANSIAGVENTTGADFEDLYDAWILANYLDMPSESGAGGYPIGYNEIDLTPFVSNTFSPWSIARSIKDNYGSDHHGELPIDRYFGGFQSGTVEFPLAALPPYAPLYGSYAGIQPEMNVFVRGDASSGVPPHGGGYEVASGSGHLLTDRMLQLDVPVGGTLSFWTWFDIEEEWDYGFVEASTDGGATWEPLEGDITRHSTDPNHSTAWANSLVGGMAETNTAITGSSADMDTDDDGWIEGTFTLPAAANVLVRFSYYTDEAVNGQGWFIDDVSVNGFSDGFEGGTGDWTLGGWTWTTGLFANDWISAYVNPVYDRGKLQSIDYGYIDGAPAGDFEIISDTLDTSGLNRAYATFAISNRPGDSPFDAGYLILVDKGTAQK
jgi:hypothetical protein